MKITRLTRRMKDSLATTNVDADRILLRAQLDEALDVMEALSGFRAYWAESETGKTVLTKGWRDAYSLLKRHGRNVSHWEPVVGG